MGTVEESSEKLSQIKVEHKRRLALQKERITRQQKKVVASDSSDSSDSIDSSDNEDHPSYQNVTKYKESSNIGRGSRGGKGNSASVIATSVVQKAGTKTGKVMILKPRMNLEQTQAA